MKTQAPRDEALRESLFDNTLDGLAYCQMLFDPQGQPVDFLYVEVNKNFEKLWGLKEVVGKKATDLIPGIRISNPEVFEIYGRVSLTGKPEKFETYIEPLSRWFLVSVYSPKKKFFVAVFQNITDRKQIEKNLENSKIAARNVLEDLQVERERLAEAKAKDEALLGSIGDGVIATDNKGRVVLINKTAEKLLDKQQEEVIGKVLSEIIPIQDEKGLPILPGERPIGMALAAATTTTTTTTGPIYHYVRKDKTTFPAAITVTPVMLGGEVIGAIEVFRDITKEKEVDRVKTEFVSLASHQLRTPITSIRWYAEMLLRNDVGPLKPDQKKYVTEIYKSDRRMIDLVNSLLNISRIELGTLAVRPEAIDVREMLREIEKDSGEQIAEKKIRLEYQCAHGSTHVKTDRQILRIILQNLFTNAVEYTAHEGSISLRVENFDAETRITVADSGCGIPLDVQDKIFTKFFRADNARMVKPDGSGLGLYMTKSLVEALGGSIRFESNGANGTTFFLTVPSFTQGKEGSRLIS